MLLTYREEPKQPRRLIAGLPLLEFSPVLESWSDIYTGPTSCLIVPQTFSSFVFYPPSLSFTRLARLMSVLCTEGSLLHIMSRHAPYCWLATSLFWYSAQLSFLKHFWKITYPTFNRQTDWAKSFFEKPLPSNLSSSLTIQTRPSCHHWTSRTIQTNTSWSWSSPHPPFLAALWRALQSGDDALFHAGDWYWCLVLFQGRLPSGHQVAESPCQHKHTGGHIDWFQMWGKARPTTPIVVCIILRKCSFRLKLYTMP